MSIDLFRTENRRVGSVRKGSCVLLKEAHRYGYPNAVVEQVYGPKGLTESLLVILCNDDWCDAGERKETLVIGICGLASVVRW